MNATSPGSLSSDTSRYSGGRDRAHGAVAGKYRKTHIPHGPGDEEKFYFAPGDMGYRVVEPPGAGLRIGLAICWDQWFPEVGRALGLGLS